MPILSATNLSIQFGDDLILDGVSLSIEANERIGIVGRNGCGKSTLLKILAGIQKPDDGSVSVSKTSKPGYLHQNPDLNPEHTMRQAVASAFDHLKQLQARLDEIFEEMGNADESTLEQLLKEQERIEYEIDAAGGTVVDHKVDQILHGLLIEA